MKLLLILVLVFGLALAVEESWSYSEESEEDPLDPRTFTGYEAMARGSSLRSRCRFCTSRGQMWVYDEHGTNCRDVLSRVESQFTIVKICKFVECDAITFPFARNMIYRPATGCVELSLREKLPPITEYLNLNSKCERECVSRTGNTTELVHCYFPSLKKTVERWNTDNRIPLFH